MTTLRGQLLVAAPNLLDPNFHRTVVLVGEHGDEGATHGEFFRTMMRIIQTPDEPRGLPAELLGFSNGIEPGHRFGSAMSAPAMSRPRG